MSSSKSYVLRATSGPLYVLLYNRALLCPALLCVAPSQEHPWLLPERELHTPCPLRAQLLYVDFRGSTKTSGQAATSLMLRVLDTASWGYPFTMWHLPVSQLRQRRWHKIAPAMHKKGRQRGREKGMYARKGGGAKKVRKRGYTPHLLAREPPFRTLFVPSFSRVNPLLAPFSLLFRTHYSGMFILLYCDLQ